MYLADYCELRFPFPAKKNQFRFRKAPAWQNPYLEFLEAQLQTFAEQLGVLVGGSLSLQDEQ